jgi:hypothetical protein
VGHADANRHTPWNTRTLPVCVFNTQAPPANPNSWTARGGPGAMHNGMCSRWEWDEGRVFGASLKQETLARGVNPNRIS